ncbi:hypothetical protein FRB93_005414 [Tulasnella sp. JGI-2019a]|nr:hypothetical protein FRB93_005414 [Tulasnella sp. JGI-2019a]
MANSKPLMPNLILDYLGSKPQHKKHAWGLDLITDEEVKLIEETSKFDEVTTEEEDWEIVNFIPDSVAEESTRVLTSPFSHRKSDVDGSAKSADQSKFITQEDYEPPAGGDHLAELLQRQLQREIEHSHSLGILCAVSSLTSPSTGTHNGS